MRPALAPVVPAATRIWLAAGVTDMCSGFNGLAAKVEMALNEDPYSGRVFVSRGRRGDLVRVLWWTGDGLCPPCKRLERGRFVWPQASEGMVAMTQAQLSMLLEGIDWRMPTLRVLLDRFDLEFFRVSLAAHYLSICLIARLKSIYSSGGDSSGKSDRRCIVSTHEPVRVAKNLACELSLERS